MDSSMLFSLQTGNTCNAPADVLMASAFTVTLPLAGITIASTPAHSQVRAIAPEITDIGYAVQKYDERILSLFINERNNIFQTLISNSRNKGNHSLMILPGQAVKTFGRYTLYRNIASFQHLEQFTGKVLPATRA